MRDPLSQVAALIQPRAPFSKMISAAGRWRVNRTEVARPFYCAVLEGQSCLSASGHEPMMLAAGDFVLIPAPRDFAMASVPPPAAALVSQRTILPSGEVPLGDPDHPPDYRALIGYCVLGSPDAALLLSLLPAIILVRSDRRLTTLVELVGEEARGDRPGKDLILSHLLEVLFIEALRSTAAAGASPGLLRGLADERISVALRQLHASPAQNWTVEQLARKAALSRSTFFERFQRTVGIAPMEYLTSWRMALAKELLRHGRTSITVVAEQIGYSSSSTFSTAFTRHVGVPPARYSKANREANSPDLTVI